MLLSDRQKESFHKKKSLFFISTSEDDDAEIQRFKTSPLIISSPKISKWNVSLVYILLKLLRPMCLNEEREKEGN